MPPFKFKVLLNPFVSLLANQPNLDESPTKDCRSIQIINKNSCPCSQRDFYYRSFSHSSRGVSGLLVMAINWPWASDARNCPPWPIIRMEMSGLFLGFLWNRASNSPEPMTLYIIMSRFMKVMPHKLGTTTEAVLMQNGAKDGPSGIFYL